MSETNATEFDQTELTNRLAKDAAYLAQLGVPLDMIGRAFMSVGVHFGVAARGARAVSEQLAAATVEMEALANEVDAQSAGSSAMN